jgi:PAS domain S-box-containing protein
MVDAPYAAAEPPTLHSSVDFESAFQKAPVAMALIDRDLRYLACNRAMADINGIPCEDHLGRTVGELLPDLVGEVESRFRAAFAYGVSRQPRSKRLPVRSTLCW